MKWEGRKCCTTEVTNSPVSYFSFSFLFSLKIFFFKFLWCFLKYFLLSSFFLLLSVPRNFFKFFKEYFWSTVLEVALAGWFNFFLYLSDVPVFNRKRFLKSSIYRIIERIFFESGLSSWKFIYDWYWEILRSLLLLLRNSGCQNLL